MLINTLSAYNPCGQLGPTYTDLVFAFDLTEVFTFQPYADATVQTREGPPQQLTLADLATNCPKDAKPEATMLTTINGVVIDEHPVANTFDRCNPALSMPDAMRSVGL
jgi:hypothetical protein